MNINQAGKAPWHLWVVGVVTLLFNLGGAYDYIQTKRVDEAYIAAMTGTMGADSAAAIAYFEAFPLWMNVFWAIGVWAALAGSVLLLLRSRHAFAAFVASAIGIVVSAYYQIANPMPGVTDNTVAMVFMAVLVVVMAGVIWYSRAMTARGVLR